MLKIYSYHVSFNLHLHLQNARYRFRLINAEFLNCPIELSIDNHTIRVISSDGRDIEPVEGTYKYKRKQKGGRKKMIRKGIS